MNKLEEMQRIMNENYNEEELREFYKRKVIILKEIGANESIINMQLQKLQALNKRIEEREKQK